MPTRIEEGSEWYFLPKKWFDKWETYCYIDVIDAKADSSAEELRSVSRTSPGKICFGDLFVAKAENQMEDQGLANKW